MANEFSKIEQMVEKARSVAHGFGDIRKLAAEVVEGNPEDVSIDIAGQLLSLGVHQARMLATFIFGMLAAKHPELLTVLKAEVSNDADWRVQEALAMAFDNYCMDTGYEEALPVIRDWLSDPNPNVRRAVTEGLRIWTSRDYFRQNPQEAIRLLSSLRDDESEYVRKSVGNALRDISRKHGDLVRAEVESWTISGKRIAQTYKLASKFIQPG